MAGRRLAVLLTSLAIAGCSSSSAHHKPAPKPAAGQPGVSLSLEGGGKPERIEACGMTGSYKDYPLGGYVRYSGRVTPTPSGAWQVKVKLKRCTPRGFSETFFELVSGRSDGTFSGQVPKLNPNEFYVRADYRRPAGTVRSPLAFFRTFGTG